jgi:hypothetical protein
MGELELDIPSVGIERFLAMIGERGYQSRCYSQPCYYSSLGWYIDDLIDVLKDGKVLGTYNIVIISQYFTEKVMASELDNLGKGKYHELEKRSNLG